MSDFNERHLRIWGGSALKGELDVSGSKNSILPLLFASLLAKGEHQFKNVPQLKDVSLSLEIFSSLGVPWIRSKDHLVIQNKNSIDAEPCSKSARAFRASILCLAPLLSLKKKVKIPLPGGCEIGARPIDLHIKGLEKMGAKIWIQSDFIHAQALSGLTASRIKLDFPSVGATENLIMASVLAKGISYLENTACEPEIKDLISYLQKMGAKIENLSERTLKITGVSSLKALEKAFTVIPDRIEAGTWLLSAACSRGEVLIKKCDPKHLTALIEKLKLAGFHIESGSSEIFLKSGKEEKKSVSIKTGVYPAFPTDLQSQFMALMSRLKGDSVLEETIFENRFRYVEQLNRLGAGIRIDNSSRAFIKGPVKLYGNRVTATDLRAGAGLVLAGLMAQGLTKVYGLNHIERGYESFADKLKLLKAKVELQ